MAQLAEDPVVPMLVAAVVALFATLVGGARWVAKRFSDLTEKLLDVVADNTKAMQRQASATEILTSKVEETIERDREDARRTEEAWREHSSALHDLSKSIVKLEMRECHAPPRRPAAVQGISGK